MISDQNSIYGADFSNREQMRLFLDGLHPGKLLYVLLYRRICSNISSRNHPIENKGRCYRDLRELAFLNSNKIK
jgi:hypothetical protein